MCFTIDGIVTKNRLLCTHPEIPSVVCVCVGGRVVEGRPKILVSVIIVFHIGLYRPTEKKITPKGTIIF